MDDFVQAGKGAAGKGAPERADSVGARPGAAGLWSSR